MYENAARYTSLWSGFWGSMIRTSTPPKRGQLQGIDQRRVRDEVRAGNPQPLLGRIDGVHEEQPARFEHVRGIGAEAERRFVVFRGGVRRPIELGHVAGGPVPVFEKGELNRLDDGAADFDVRIAPRSELRMPAHVFVADVEAADVGHFAVGDHDLAMVAEVDLKPVAKALRRAKRQDHDAGRGQLAAIGPRQVVAADLVVEHVHADDPRAALRSSSSFSWRPRLSSRMM